MSLKDAKVGDTIKATSRYPRIEQVFVVTALTPTLAKCENDVSFRRDNGLMIGTGGDDEFHRQYGNLASPEDVTRIQLETRLRDAQHSIAKLNVTPENLEAVESLLKLAKEA